MSSSPEGENDEAQRVCRGAAERTELLHNMVGEPISVANEFAEVRLVKVETRNGSRVLIESPKSGQWVTMCPLELEALTWQSTTTFSAMVGNPFSSLIRSADEG